MTSSPPPPGWPAPVRPPGAPEWQTSAVNWLLDQCPADYRAYPLLTRRPLVLAWLAGRHAEAALDGVRRSLAAARGDLVDDVPAPAMTELLELLATEQARLIAVRRAVGLIEQALRGHRFIPRL